MESWSSVPVGKSFASEEPVEAPDAVACGKNSLMGVWKFKPSSSFGSNMVSSREEQFENQGFGELGFSEVIRKQLPNNLVLDIFNTEASGFRTPNAFSGEEESTSKPSSSVVDSNCRDSSIFDLKLWRFGDHRDSQNYNSSNSVTPYLSSAEALSPRKRNRAGGVSNYTPFCQVHGCKKDLSSSKDYHKRHKVCEVHSKTARVIVNGSEQRFCQQCSRFHFLAEFDDGKRSCRKRLAGHNERRRKPHVGIHPGRTGRLFQSYNATMIQGTITTPSFICQGIIPCSILHPKIYETNNCSTRIKLENEGKHNPQLAIPMANGHSHPRFPFTCDFGDGYLPHHDKDAYNIGGGKINNSSDRCHPAMASSNSIPCSSFQNTTIGSGDFTIFDAASASRGLSDISDSSIALSLLSSQSQNSSSHSSGVTAANPMIVPRSHARYSVNEFSEKLLQMNMQPSISGVSNKFKSSGMNSVDSTRSNPIINLDDNDAMNFGTSGIFQGSAYINTKDCLSYEDGTPINLLQLSSQLQRVEHQRKSLQDAGKTYLKHF